MAVPYDFEAGKTWAVEWVLERIVLNVSITLVYVGWWYVSLFHFGWAERKYNPENRPSLATMIHNVWYTTLGALQWAMWECLFVSADHH